VKSVLLAISAIYTGLIKPNIHQGGKVAARKNIHPPTLLVLVPKLGATLYAPAQVTGSILNTTQYPEQAVTFALVMVLAFDLDRAGEGLIAVSQQPMIDLYKNMLE